MLNCDFFLGQEEEGKAEEVGHGPKCSMGK